MITHHERQPVEPNDECLRLIAQRIDPDPAPGATVWQISDQCLPPRYNDYRGWMARARMPEDPAEPLQMTFVESQTGHDDIMTLCGEVGAGARVFTRDNEKTKLMVRYEGTAAPRPKKVQLQQPAARNSVALALA